MNNKLLLSLGKFVRNVMGGMVCGCATGCYVVWQQQFIVRTLIIKKLGHLEADNKMLYKSAIRDCRGFESRQASCWEIYFCWREVVTSSKGGQNYTKYMRCHLMFFMNDVCNT